MPRHKTVTDEALLDVALQVMSERGPDALTFQAIAPRAGISASTIVQRFGTKAALRRAALTLAWDRLDAETAAVDHDATAGPAGVVDLLVRLGAQYSEDTYADQLLILREDLLDPVLRARGCAWLDALVAAVERRLAVAPDNIAGVGELVVQQWQGALTVWSFRRDVALNVAVRSAVEPLLERLGYDLRV
ncbi:TetR/AcrR family transcriptional regulator [Nocardia sp. NPDC058499]|uniref:TetR/AcrR family transcriptional regulator n=1 Tax=Nocardia sp. NPDC058499 TaxID=3346530 RepID=UPI0036660EE5